MKEAKFLSFEDIAQLVARAIHDVLPKQFQFVLIMVTPDNDVKMLHNCKGGQRHANDVVAHVANHGRGASRVAGGVERARLIVSREGEA